MTKQKVGLVACSSILERRFLPALKKSKTSFPFIIGSRDKIKALNFSKEYNIPHHGTYEDVFTNPEVDWVYISTPPSQHEEQIIAAAENGKHILCEKPAVMSLASAKKINEVCRQNNVHFFEGYVYKFHPQHQVVKAQLSDLGKPFLLKSQFTYPRPASGDIRYDSSLGGGVFDALGYTVNVMLMLLEKTPHSVYTLQINDDKHDVDQAVSLTFEYKDGPIVHAFAGYGVQYSSNYELSCEKGILALNRAFSMNTDTVPVIYLEQGMNKNTLTLDPSDQFLSMIEAFSSFSLTGQETSLINSGEFFKPTSYYVSGKAVADHRKRLLLSKIISGKLINQTSILFRKV